MLHHHVRIFTLIAAFLREREGGKREDEKKNWKVDFSSLLAFQVIRRGENFSTKVKGKIFH